MSKIHRLSITSGKPCVVGLRRFRVSDCTMPVSDKLCTKRSCRYHLRGDARGNERPMVDEAELPTLCALEAVTAYGSEMKLDLIGGLLGITYERARQLETSALKKLADNRVPAWREVKRHG